MQKKHTNVNCYISGLWTVICTRWKRARLRVEIRKWGVVFPAALVLFSHNQESQRQSHVYGVVRSALIVSAHLLHERSLACGRSAVGHLTRWPQRKGSLNTHSVARHGDERAPHGCRNGHHVVDDAFVLGVGDVRNVEDVTHGVRQALQTAAGLLGLGH